MSTNGEGLRQGSDGVIHVQIVDGYEEPNLAGHTVTATAQFPGSPDGPFDVTVTPLSPNTSSTWFIFAFAGANLNQSGDLYVEITINGLPQRNPNAAPIIVPVRAPYAFAA